MKIKNHEYTSNKVSYTACYDGLEIKIIHKRTKSGVKTTDINNFIKEVAEHSSKNADAIECFVAFQEALMLEGIEFEIENVKEVDDGND